MLIAFVLWGGLGNTLSTPLAVLSIPRALADCNISVGGFAFFSTAVGTKVFVNNYGSDSVSVINSVTDTVTATISVGTNPYMSVNSGTKLYVINYGSSNVSVINTTTNTVSTTISVGANPYWATLVGTKLYVSNYGAGTVSVIDTATDTVTSTISGISTAYVSTAIGSKLYVSKYGGTSVAVIDTSTDTLSTSITVGTTPYSSVAVGTKLYVGNYNSANVSVIDSATDTVTSTITVGNRPYDIKAIGTKVYVSNAFSDTVSVINTATDTVSSTITVGDSPYYMSVSGTKIYVSNFLDGTLSVINSATDTVSTTIALMTPAVSDPYSTTLLGTKLYVERINTNIVGVVDTSTDTLLSSCGAAAPGTPDMTAATDSGSSNTDDVTSDTTPDFEISCIAGATVELREGSTTLASGVCPVGGTITLTSSTLAEGSHTVNARQNTGGGMGPNSGNLAITIDTTAPAAPGTPDMTTGTDLGVSSSDNITSDSTPNFTMSCTGTDTITLTQGATTIGTGTCAGGTVTITSSSLSDGTYSVTATQTDAAGNVSASSSALSVTISTSVPTISSLTPTGNASGLTGTTNLTAVFSQAVQPMTGTITIKTVSDNATVETIDVTSLQVTGGGTTTITIDPSVTLSLDVAYYVLIDATAFDSTSGVDFAGISLSTTWQFTLVSPVTPSSSSTESSGGGGGGGGGGSRKSNEIIISQLPAGNLRGKNWKEESMSNKATPEYESQGPFSTRSGVCSNHSKRVSAVKYADIPDYWFTRYARDTSRLGVFPENDNHLFLPLNTVSTDEFAFILYKLLEPDARDVPEGGYRKAVIGHGVLPIALESKGNERVSREVAIAALMRAFCITSEPSAEVFRDVRMSDTYGTDIYAGAALKVVLGYLFPDDSPTGYFKPNASITRDELATMLVRLVNIMIQR